MYAVGHLALGYLSGKVSGKLLNVNPNISLLLLASVIPDVDILTPGLEHRGPTHSIVISIALLIPAMLLYGKKAVPYFLAFAQHFLIGDYITGGAHLLWPLTSHIYGRGLEMTSPINIILEWSLFLASMALMLKMKDVWLFFRRQRSNLLLSTPLFTVLLPSFLSFPTHVPFELLIPHLTYLTLFVLSLVKDLKFVLTN